ncbi:hypothetical protein C8F01DRAFT_1255284 [Mycena amicta]|nr:hypothetical protein C8F01DRAFT_1255284 [Mycena amicta]
MSPSGPSSSTVSGSRVLRSSNAVASGSGSGLSSHPSSSKKRRIQSDSSSLAPEEPEPKRIVVLRVPKLPIPTPLVPKASFFVLSFLALPLLSPRFVPPNFGIQPRVPNCQLAESNPYRRSVTISCVGDPVRTRESQDETMAEAVKSADTTRRFRLHASEGFLYPKSSVPTQDFPSVDMCLRRMEMSRIRLQGLTREDGPFSKAEYLSLPPAPVDIPVWDVLSETRNAAIASAEYRVALRREFDCAGTRAHAHQLYQELTRALQFLVENGDLSGFEDPYLDFTNTLLLQRLQAKDPSCGYRFRRFDSFRVPPSDVHLPQLLRPGLSKEEADALPLASESLPVYPVPCSVLSSYRAISLGYSYGGSTTTSPVQLKIRTTGSLPLVTALARSQLVISTLRKARRRIWTEMAIGVVPNRVPGTRVYASFATRRIPKTTRTSKRFLLPPLALPRRNAQVDVPGSPDVVVVSDDDKKGYWRGAHFVVESCLDSSQSRHSSIAFILVLGEGSARFHSARFAWRITVIDCVKDGVPCTYTVPGVSGRPFADGRTKKAAPPPVFSKCTRCRLKRLVCVDASKASDHPERSPFSSHFCELVAWLHHVYNYRRKEFNEFQNRIDASVRDTVSSSSDSDSPEAGPVLSNDEMIDDEVIQPAAPVFGTKSNPTPLPGDITATPPDQVPVPTLLGLPLRGLKKGVYRGDVWESNLVPAPQLPAELPPFLGGSHPYRRTRIVEDAEPSYKWPDVSYRPPVHDDDFVVPEDALAIDVRADSIVGKLEYGRVAEFQNLDGDTLVDTFVQLVRRGQHAVTVMTRAIVYALGPKLLQELNRRGTDLDIPRLGATLDGVPLPYPTPLPSISGDLALHAHLSRMAGAEHPFSAFIRAALDSDTMRSYATGQGSLEHSELVEWEHFAESSLFKHFFLKQSKKAPNKPFIPLWSPSSTLQVAAQQASQFGSSKDSAAVDFGLLGRGMDVSGSSGKPPEWAKELERQHKIVDTAKGKASPPFAESHMRKLRSAIEETVAPARLFSPARRASVAIVEGGSLPDGYRVRDSSRPPRLPLFFPEPEPPKNVEPDDEQSMDQSSGERPRDQLMDFSVGERHELVVDGIAVLPGASESKDDVEADVSMEVIEPEDDELNGD